MVISPLYEYLHTPGAKIYRSVDEFIALVTEALTRNTPRNRQLRQEAVLDCTWDVRAREVATLFRLLDGQATGKALSPLIRRAPMKSVSVKWTPTD